VHPWWIRPGLAIVPRPRGDDWLDEEMLALKAAGVDVVVSMLEDAEAAELGLKCEDVAARSASMKFLHFPIPDRAVPSDTRSFECLLSDLEKLQAAGMSVGVHCRACIGRATLTAASLLIRSGVTRL